MNLGEKIKQRRREKNLSQEKLGELLNVHENTIRKWEKGISSPSAEELQRLANELETTTTDLYNENYSFIKNSAYQDKTEIQNSFPSMGYWGTLLDNAEKAAEIGKNLDLIIPILNKALLIIETAFIAEQKQQQQKKQNANNYVQEST